MNNEARSDWRWRITITHYATGEPVEVDGGRIVDATQPEAIDKVDERAYDIQTDWEALESNCHGTMLRKSEGRRTATLWKEECIQYVATYRNAYGDIMQSAITTKEEMDNDREYAKRNRWTVEFDPYNGA